MVSALCVDEAASVCFVQKKKKKKAAKDRHTL